MKINKWTGLILALLLVVGIFPLTAVPAFAESTSAPPLTVTIPTLWCGSTYGGMGMYYYPVTISGSDDYILDFSGLLMEDESGYLGYDTLRYSRTYNGGNAAYIGITVEIPENSTLTKSDITIKNGTLLECEFGHEDTDYHYVTLVVKTRVKHVPGEPAEEGGSATGTQPVYCAVCGRVFNGTPGTTLDLFTLSVSTVKCGTVVEPSTTSGPHNPINAPISISGGEYGLVTGLYVVSDPNSPIGYSTPQEEITYQGGDTVYIGTAVAGNEAPRSQADFTVKGASIVKYMIMNPGNGNTPAVSMIVLKTTAKHDYGSWEVTKEPTPTETGMKQRVCKECGHVQKQKLPAFGITKQPSKKAVAEGEKASFSVTAVGTDLTYQWQYSKDGGSTWKDCKSDGYDSRTFSFTATASMDGRLYRCKVADKYSEATSNSAKLTVTASKPVITKQPAALSIIANKTGQFSVTATGSDLTYQWQYSKDGGSTWTDCTSASHDKATFSFTPKVSMDDRLYRCVVSNSAGSVTSDSVKLLVAGAKPAVTTQPSAQSVNAGTTVKFSVKATGSGLKYQWQYSKDNGKTWTDCVSPNHDKATFNFVAKDSMNGRLYRCVVTNAYGKATSSTAKLTVK